MSAIQTIIATYIRFADEQALLALRAHRLKLLAAIDESDPFFKTLRSQCIEEISAIEAGLGKLRPPAAALPDMTAARSISAATDPVAQEQTGVEPVAGPEQDTVAGPAAAIGADQAAFDPAPSPEPQKPLPVRAGTFNPGLIASSVLGAALAATTGSNTTNLAAELIRLQLRLEKRLKD